MASIIILDLALTGALLVGMELALVAEFFNLGTMLTRMIAVTDDEIVQ
jgi:hypothetical protein